VNATATPLPATRAAPTITGNFIAMYWFCYYEIGNRRKQFHGHKATRCDESHSLLGPPF
jgi:hypothetical protein